MKVYMFSVLVLITLLVVPTIGNAQVANDPMAQCSAICCSRGYDSYECILCAQYGQGGPVLGSYIGDGYSPWGLFTYAAVAAVYYYYQYLWDELQECYAQHPNVVVGGSDDICSKLVPYSFTQPLPIP